MAFYKSEKVSLKEVILELKDYRKTPVLNNIIQEIKDYEILLEKLDEENKLEYYEIYLKTLSDKLGNATHFVGVIAFSGVVLTIFSKIYETPSTSLLYLVFWFVILILGSFPIMSKRKSRILFALNCISHYKEKKKINEISTADVTTTN